ncbi:MAG: hypothetical protein R3E98_08550 [Gemmatimonadota bacterium]|nr:hypothetical protein [Gemmatimonadota bacterium]
MTDTTVFSRTVADRVLRRAAEIEGSDDTRISIEELRSLAREAGFGSRAIERALGEARGESLGQDGATAQRPPVQRWGLLFTRMATIREVPVEISSEQLMRVVRLFQPYREGPAQVRLEEHEITWRDERGLHFAVTSVGGSTVIRVHLGRLLLRRGRWMGWVKAAADRLELLTLLVARPDGGGERTPALPSGR